MPLLLRLRLQPGSKGQKSPTQRQAKIYPTPETAPRQSELGQLDGIGKARADIRCSSTTTAAHHLYTESKAGDARHHGILRHGILRHATTSDVSLHPVRRPYVRQPESRRLFSTAKISSNALESCGPPLELSPKNYSTQIRVHDVHTSVECRNYTLPR